MPPQNSPTITLGSPQNFTLGCGTKGYANIICYITPTTSGANSYTVIGPPTSTSIPSGPLFPSSNFTITTAGTWTYVVRDNITGCTTYIPFAILQNTFAPDVSVAMQTQTLNCYVPSVTLNGSSNTQNTTFSWFLPDQRVLQRIQLWPLVILPRLSLLW